MSKTNIDKRELYYFIKLVIAGWKYDYYEDRWLHPEGKKTIEYRYSDEETETKYWKFEAAINEVEYE